MSLLQGITVLSAVLGLLFLLGGAYAIRCKRFLGLAATWTLALLLLVIAALCATISVATQGYRALTREEIAAVVNVEPFAGHRFEALFRFPDGREAHFGLQGDALYVDAHILKWKPGANLLGLHTVYELDRVAGRYVDLEDEKTLPRTVFALGTEKPLDLFNLRRRFSWLQFLVDAEYGSATFMLADGPANFEVRVSTTGLLMRRANEPE
jgi:hypothetical protein